MRPSFIGLFVAIMAAITLPTVAMAATPKAPTIDPAARAKGMAAAPGIIKTAGIDCSLADARWIITSQDPKTKVSTSYYEIGCGDNAEGYFVGVASDGSPPQVLTCLEIAASASKTSATCILPQNANPASGLGALVLKNKPGCVVADAKGIGHASDGSKTDFEITCQNGAGYIIETSYPVSISKPVIFSPCVQFTDPAGLTCSLVTPASQLALIDSFAGKMGKPCAVKDRRYVGSSPDGSDFFEVACQDGKGYMVQLNNDGTVAPAIDCLTADGIAGGCTLTDTRQAQTQQKDLYTKLANQAGFPCTVSKYAPFDSAPAGYDVVELQCSNRPDGAVGIFGGDASKPTHVYDCAHADLAGYRCSFSTRDASVVSLTGDLKALGKNECVVSGSRYMGKATDGNGYIEVACADGLPGYVIGYAPNSAKPASATACTLAKPLLDGCTMPANHKH